MEEKNILLEGQEAEDLKKYLAEDELQLLVTAFLKDYGITQEQLDESKEMQYGLLEEYRELEAATKKKAEEDANQEPKKPETAPVSHVFDWASEVDNAIKKGWLNKKDRETALELIQTDRDAYDKLLTIKAEEKK